jgi:Ca2+-binding RTX toxin-like protein
MNIQTPNRPHLKIISALVLLIAVLCAGHTASFAQFRISGIIAKTIKAEGPGTFYAAWKDQDNLGFWIVDDSVARFIGSVPRIDPVYDQQIVTIDLSNSVAGVFFTDDLPLSKYFRMQFIGTLENKKCPQCTIAAPLPARQLTGWLAKVKSDTRVADSADLMKVVQNQNTIYGVAKTTGDDLLKQKDAFVARQEADLYEFYSLISTASREGETKLNKALADAQAFEKQLNARVTADTAYAQKTADTYEKLLTAQAPRLEAALRCAKTDSFFQSAAAFEAQLGLNAYPDPLPDNFEEDTLPPSNTNRETMVTQFEARSLNLQDVIEPCVKRLLGDFLTDITDVNPGVVQTLSQGSFIQPLPYETLGNQVTVSNANTEADIDVWQQGLEQKTARFDKLPDHLQFEQSMEVLTIPLLQSVNPRLLAKTPSFINDSQAESESADPANSLVPASFSPKSVFAPAPNPCGNDPYLTINLIAVTIVIATDKSDSITVNGNDNNIIFGFAGDDCIDAMGGYDLVFGMAGEDTIFGGDDHDFLFGGDGVDKIYGGKGNGYNVKISGVALTLPIGNFISGDGGSDILNGSNENGTAVLGFTDVILGDGFASAADSGIDTIDGDAGIDFIFGQAKDDFLTNTGYGAVRVAGIRSLHGSGFFGGTGDDTIHGTSIPTVLGSSYGDLILGGAGVDTVRAGKNIDFVFGEGDDDKLYGNEDADFLFGQKGEDTIYGNDGPEIIAGGAGGDIIFSNAGVGSLLLGNTDSDTINGGPGVDLAFGGTGNDTISGGDGIVDILSGGDQIDKINGMGGTDIITGGKDRDVIDAGDNVDLALGGDDTDTISGMGGTDIIIGGSNSPVNPPFPTVERLDGGPGMDFIWGNTGNDAISGGDGIDLLSGGEGNDIILGDDKLDFMWGADGDDIIQGGPGFDIGAGNKGNDDLDGGDGTDLLIGGENDDTLKGGIGVDLLVGFSGDDKLFGGDQSDLLAGGRGNDILQGENDPDLLWGGFDNDTASGNAGFNLILGNEGDDKLFGGPVIDVISGGIGADEIFGGAGTDILFGGGDGEKMMDGQGDGDLVFGNEGNDIISMTGAGGTNLICGNRGNDTIVAFEARNLIFGNANDDNLNGADGSCSNETPRDYLFGNGGSDSLRGNKKNARDLLFGGSKTRC